MELLSRGVGCVFQSFFKTLRRVGKIGVGFSFFINYRVNRADFDEKRSFLIGK